MPESVPPLQVRELRLTTTEGVDVVADVSFSVGHGEVLALVGESGSGKTTTALALLGHARPGMQIAGGSVLVDGLEMLGISRSELTSRRGSRISYVPQDPSTSLDPRQRIGTQLREVMAVHGLDGEDARTSRLELIERVGLPATTEFLRRYPFELSGGQQQRVLIAMALACRPAVVVLDEPTTGLDVTTQAKVLDLLGELTASTKRSFVYVTHDLAVVDQLADRVAVMYAGRIVESGSRKRVLNKPSHPYTARLLEALPRLSVRRRLQGVSGAMVEPGSRPPGCFFHSRCELAQERCVAAFPPVTETAEGGSVRCWRAGEATVQLPAHATVDQSDAKRSPILEVSGLVAGYGRTAEQPTVQNVSFDVARGECVALVGESGSGKSTIARCVGGLHAPLSGTVALEGTPLARHVSARLPAEKRAIQFVFQNPDRSLNPSSSVGSIVGRPLVLLNGERGEVRKQAAELLERVHLPRRYVDRYPHELSGGEKQRVAIARALAPGPEILICDEVTSALDVSVQAAIVGLLEELRRDGLAMLFITHNLALVNTMAQRTLVLRAGQLCESGPTSQVMSRPQSPYTRELLDAAPELGSSEPEQHVALAGE
jgi:peptide/nickel transport system ATP-binding protein